MRIRWRRLLAKSWLVSRWHYRRHGLVLGGRPSDEIWYFAYGSNMDEGTFVHRRGIWPLDRRVGRVGGYRLRFNLEGRPEGKAAPANICPEPNQEVWGVLYRITRRNLLRLDSTEGVPGRGYKPTWLHATDLDGNPVSAIAYVATGKDIDGRPSLRYISLLREGARFHGLPEHWLFAGSDRGGERAALMYSLIVTAKLNNVDPRSWLADVQGAGLRSTARRFKVSPASVVNIRRLFVANLEAKTV